LALKPIENIMPNVNIQFEAYIQPHWRQLQVVARQYAKRPEDAHDLVQETLLRAWRAFNPNETYVRQWLFSILRNAALEWSRNASRRVRLTLLPNAELTELLPSDIGAPLTPLRPMSEADFRQFLDDRILDALDALEEPFREVLILSVAGDLTYREISEILDCPLGTVMSRMARARRFLRDRLATFQPGRKAASTESKEVKRL
jgi:RNA polymerase sigma-70 factor (ECF subfamily)